MNSDPYDSAVWRSFGMLDADESAIFDEASRVDPLLRGAFLEMDRLSAAIAVATSTPVEPKAGQLERLEARLSIHKVRRGPWIAAISGWAAAAALAVMWLLDHGRTGSSDAARESTQPVSPQTDAPGTSTNPAVPETSTDRDSESTASRDNVPGTTTMLDETAVKAKVRTETKRLSQEIEVLRENLEKFQSRDRVLFEAVPGMALPVVMTMNPPATAGEDASVGAANDEPSPIAALLTGSQRGSSIGALTTEDHAEPPDAPEPAPVDHPMAIPIYDAARDSGTLVVSNLPPAEDGKVYNLWVRTLNADKPVFVGSLPAGNNATGAESFDFTLGTTMALPSGFMLTKDPADRPTTPGAANTVLQGPPTPGR